MSRPRPKIDAVLKAVSRKSGATSADLIQRLGMTPGSVRVAIHKLKAEGHLIIRDRDARATIRSGKPLPTRYRIAQPLDRASGTMRPGGSAS